ncbi:hypothetical protein [Mammaliicoccus sciuri]|uniref:hypothetical protein n=1 Tax=Mammaliicoccus sciuri TaxID=1296 RepID=UPI00118B1FD9|nr:hypothetical protein [Mammaliicoccus sciuri]QDR65715.1 hypothetical protein FPV13_12840 [Mammaliicoccus sciuri]
MEIVQFNGVSNPGWYFTTIRLQQLNQLYDWVLCNKGSIFSYKEIQQQIENDNEILDKSKIRMFFPWLKRYGIFDYANDSILVSNLLTKLGEQFFVFNKIYLELYEVEDERVVNTLNQILEDFICQFFINLLNSEKDMIFKKCVEYIKKEHQLTQNQFLILTNSIEKKKSEKWVEDMMELEKEGELVIEIKKNANSWDYNMKLMSKAGLVYFDKKVIYPTKKFSKILGGLESDI